MKIKFIVISSMISIFILYYIEQVLILNYPVKVILRTIMFILFPYIYFKFFCKTSLLKELIFKKLDKHKLFKSVGLGLITVTAIFIAFYICSSYIDFNLISSEFQSKSKVSFTGYIFVALYVTFINSFIEEVFFRGYIFMSIYKLGYKYFGMILSSLLFSIYHITVFFTWFDLNIMILALLGLFLGGMLFCTINTKDKNIVNSYVSHICADIALVIIGFIYIIK